MAKDFFEKGIENFQVQFGKAEKFPAKGEIFVEFYLFFPAALPQGRQKK